VPTHGDYGNTQCPEPQDRCDSTANLSGSAVRRSAGHLKDRSYLERLWKFLAEMTLVLVATISLGLLDIVGMGFAFGRVHQDPCISCKRYAHETTTTILEWRHLGQISNFEGTSTTRKGRTARRCPLEQPETQPAVYHEWSD